MCNTRHTTHHCETSSTHIGLISMRLWYDRVAMNICVSVAVEGDVSYFSLSKWWLFKVKFFKQIDLHAYYCVTGLDYVRLWHHLQTSNVCSVHIKVCITACSNQYASNYLMMNSKAPHSTNTWSLCLVLLSAQHPFEAEIAKRSIRHKQSNKHLTISLSLSVSVDVYSIYVPFNTSSSSSIYTFISFTRNLFGHFLNCRQINAIIKQFQTINRYFHRYTTHICMYLYIYIPSIVVVGKKA